MTTERDLKRLKGVHPDLVKVYLRGRERIMLETGMTVFITEGVRTLDRQQQLVAAGASRTLKSKHITGDAFDFAVMMGGELRWDWPLYKRCADIFKTVATEIGVKIEAGADWKKFPDGPHIERKVDGL